MSSAAAAGVAERRWLSAHLFFSGDLYGGPADRLLREVVEPLAASLSGSAAAESAADRWFFLRYNDPSPHLRLRFSGPRELLEERVRPGLEAAALAAGEEAVQRLEWAAYEPEVERYGGPEGVALAEEVFHRSSEAALALLRKIDSADRPARLGKALLAMLVLIHAYRPRRAEAAAFARGYGHSYLRTLVPDPQLQQRWLEAFTRGFGRQSQALSNYVEAAWEALQEASGLTLELDAYRRDMAAFVNRLEALWRRRRLASSSGSFASWQECVGRIVPSYLHMMNNRLGVNLQEESYLSVLVDLTLQRCSENPAPVATITLPEGGSMPERVTSNHPKGETHGKDEAQSR